MLTAHMVALGLEAARTLGMVPYYLYRQKYMAGNLENTGYALPGHACLYNVDLMEETSHILALGALKYFILKVDPTKNMLFNPAESIDFNGNTGPFIQYTHARIKSIVRKAGEINTSASQHIGLGEKERGVVKVLHSLPETLAAAAAAYSPAMVANYAYDLAKAFNSFYQDTPILKEENTELKHFRVQLCAMVANALKNTMNILGIEVPERM
jgi:arginyl-tRNA synthetase